MEFLRARLDDDERVARRVEPNQAPVDLRAMVTRDGSRPFLVIDSARVLRRVVATRRILDERDNLARSAEEMHYDTDEYSLAVLDQALAHLAAEYDEHPDYDPAWRTQ